MANTTTPMDLSQASIGQLLVPVRDLDRAIAFYRDTLGIRLLFTAPPQMSFFQVGDVRLLVGVPEEGSGVDRSALIYFRVEDIHAVVRTLESRGVTMKQQPQVVHRTPDRELWLSAFDDPDGNPLCLLSEVSLVA